MVVSFVKILQNLFLGVIFIYFEVTNSFNTLRYKTLEIYCKRKLYNLNSIKSL